MSEPEDLSQDEARDLFFDMAVGQNEEILDLFDNGGLREALGTFMSDADLDEFRQIGEDKVAELRRMRGES